MNDSSQTGWTQGPGVSLRYRISGGGRHGLVLLHELGGGLESWDEVVRELGDEFRVLRFDQRGAGFSEKPRSEFTLADHVADLERVIAAAGFQPPFHIAGVAAGAAIAVLYAAAHPGAVGKLALCAPALTADPARRDYLAERSAAAVKGGMRAIADTVLARSYPETTIRDRAAFQAYRARFLANDPVCYAYANMALANVDLADTLRRLDSPVLVVAGDKDMVRPLDDVRSLAESVPASAFLPLDAGHLVPVQAAPELSDALRSFFLAQAKQPVLKVS